MAKTNFSRALSATLQFEGGYVNHPADPGGATNMGITQRVLADWRGRSVTAADVKALTRAEAAGIYRRLYWEMVNCDSLRARRRGREGRGRTLRRAPRLPAPAAHFHGVWPGLAATCRGG
jgi:hypothetical protein